MQLYDIYTSPWAIIPGKYSSIIEIYNSYLKGPKLDLKEMESKISQSSGGKSGKEYEVRSGTAIIEIAGVLMKNPSAFMRIFYGAVSMLNIKSQIENAVNDSQVKNILLLIDSPGGTVDGTQELANYIFSMRGKKEISAFSDGMIASAAYWIASAADKIYISGDTVESGSIGVITTHVDYSEADKRSGINVTHIYAGKYKTVGSEYKPLSEDDKEYIQNQVDYLYSVFVSDIARNRNKAIDDVLKNMADAKIFIGKQAIEAGLVDGVSILDLLTGGDPDKKTGFSVDFNTNSKKEEKTVELTVEILQKDYAGLFSAVKKLGADEAASANTDIIESARQEGAEAERKRIQAVEDQSMPGHEELIQEMKFDGKTTGEQAAARIVKAEKEARDKHLKEFRESGAETVGSTEPETGSKGGNSEGEKPIEEQAKADWDKDAKLRAEFGNSFDRYLAWAKAEKEGRARILGK